MFRLPWAPPLTKAALAAISDPTSAGQPECIPWILYDTQDFVTASTTQLTFFQTVQTDQTLGNLPSQAQLPDPQHFVLHYVTCDVLAIPSLSAAGTVVGALNDIDLIMKGGRPVFTITMSDKNYGPFPLRACHALGGVTGGVAGTFAATTDIQFGNNGIPGGGGFPFMGAIVIPPKVSFKLSVQWSATQAINVSPVKIQIGLAGVLYRRVL